MARLFDDAQTEYLQYTGSVPPSAPFALAAWARTDDAGRRQAILHAGNSATSHICGIELRGDIGGDPVRMESYDGTATSQATSVSGYSVNTWHHVLGIKYADESTGVFLDGGSKGIDAPATNPLTFNRATLGAYHYNGGDGAYLSGHIADAAVWDLSGWVIADFERVVPPALAAGWSPLAFPLGLIAFWPLGGFGTSEVDGGSARDVWGGFGMTAFSAATGPGIADHPGGLIYPAGVAFFPAVAVGGATLVVQDSACIVESETVALTQHQALAVADSKCIVESEQPALTQHQVLAVDNSDCLVESETVSLTQHQVLVVQDSACVVQSEQPALTQHQTLTVADSACLVTSDSPSLTQHHALSVADSACLVTSDNVTFGGGGFAPYYYLLLAS